MFILNNNPLDINLIIPKQAISCPHSYNKYQAFTIGTHLYQSYHESYKKIFHYLNLNKKKMENLTIQQMILNKIKFESINIKASSSNEYSVDTNMEPFFKALNDQLFDKQSIYKKANWDYKLLQTDAIIEEICTQFYMEMHIQVVNNYNRINQLIKHHCKLFKYIFTLLVGICLTECYIIGELSDPNLPQIFQQHCNIQLK